MLLKKNEKGTNFEGRGEVIRKFHKLTDKTSEEVLSDLERLVKEKLKLSIGEIKDIADLKTLAKQLKLVNEKGEITALAPKTIIIKDGEQHFNESQIVADKIIQKGGVFDGVIYGRTVLVSGGKNNGIHAADAYCQFGKFNPEINGDIFAGSIKGYNTELKNKFYCSDNIIMYNGTKLSAKGVSERGGLWMNKGSEITEKGNVRVRTNIHSYDGAKISGTVISENGVIYMSNGSELSEKGQAFARVISLRPLSKFLGTANANEVIGKNAENFQPIAHKPFLYVKPGGMKV